MPRGLTSTFGRCSYNGYDFNNTTKTLGVSITPVYDSAGRTVVYNVWRIDLQTYIDAPDDTSPEVLAAVKLLSKPAGVLYYAGRGLGDPRINTDYVRDVKWGPKPGPIRTEPGGNGRWVKLLWSVEVAVPNCDDAKYQFSQLEFCYTASHQIDEAGFSTRTFAGHLSIPITRASQGDRLSPDSADLYRAFIPPPPEPGFRRRFGPWVLSEDRTRLDWTVIDEEMGVPPPPKVIEVTADDSAQSTQAGLRQWTRTITASYRMKRGATGADAAVEFMNLIRYRLAYTRDLMANLPADEGNVASMVPVGFSVSESIYDRNPVTRFSLTLTYVVSLKYLMGVSGFWRPVTGADWNEWANDVFETSFHPYAGRGLYFAPGDEILDLCGPTLINTGNAPPPRPLPNQNLPGELQGGQLVGQAMQSVLQAVPQVFPAPTPQASWMGYENNLYLETESGLIPTRPLPKKPLTNADDFLGKNSDFAGYAWDANAPSLTLPVNVPGVVVPSVNPPGVSGGILDSNVSSTDSAKSLRRVGPSVFIHMIGYGVRYGYAVDPPRLAGFGPPGQTGSVELVPACRLDSGEGVERSVNAAGVYPIHTTKWHLRYHLPAFPSSGVLPVPVNPLLDRQ